MEEMVAANGSGQQGPTKWYYKGADQEVYGPYDGPSMMQWVNTGYFKETLLVRTNHEETFHTLGDWQRTCHGKLPFLYNQLHSLEHTMFVMNPQQAAPFHLFPPGLAPPHMPPPMRHPNGINQFMMSPDFGTVSLPPSEPTEGSAVPSPEAENRLPMTRSIGTDPITVTMKDANIQTVPNVVTADQAARLLSEVFGQQVEIR